VGGWGGIGWDGGQGRDPNVPWGERLSGSRCVRVAILLARHAETLNNQLSRHDSGTRERAGGSTMGAVGSGPIFKKGGRRAESKNWMKREGGKGQGTFSKKL